jgi:hypothetical protein
MVARRLSAMGSPSAVETLTGAMKMKAPEEQNHAGDAVTIDEARPFSDTSSEGYVTGGPSDSSAFALRSLSAFKKFACGTQPTGLWEAAKPEESADRELDA